MAVAKPKRVTRPLTVTDDQIKAAIEKCSGIQTTTAKRLGISRQALWKRLNASPELKAAMSEARETLVDEAESVLVQAIRKKEAWAVRLALLTLGKDRGYSRAVHLSGSVEATGVVTILELPDNGRDKKNPA